jgi:hypothetical protein
MNSFLQLLNAKRWLILLLFIPITFQVFAANENTWPKVIENPKGIITIYEPQNESLNGNILEGRAAISVKPAKTKKPVFGAFWYKADLEVDRSTRMAVIKVVSIPNIRFSDDVDSTLKVQISKLIEGEVPKWKLEISIDNLISNLESSNYKSDGGFKNDAPEIIFSNKPAVLVLIDGKPMLKDLQGYSDFQRIENSQFFIVFDKDDKLFYMYGDRVWFSTTDLMAKWELVKKPSKSLKKLQSDIEESNKKSGQQNTVPAEEVKPENVPDIYVRTNPAELIVFEGEPKFTPVPETTLLFVENTDGNVFMNIDSQKYFILISGRWYTSDELKGPWAFVEADKLPVEFSKIPEGTEKDQVLASVAGTQAAKEAILDTQIPQTAEINRKTTSVNVEYDGEPKFEPVDGTSMLYAVNSPKTVLKVGNTFYCVDNGIWFEAPTAKGVWTVTDERPSEVDKIEASSPVYNVKYVYIYESTPEVVYVGYTPGYYGCYVYGPTIVYGTGWPYYPWYGAYYYPRPVTWGFNMSYNPWYGWGMSFGFSYGPVHFSFGGGYYGGCWGPPMYHPPCHYPPSHGGWYGHGGGNPGHDYGQRPGNERPGNGGNRPDNSLPNNRIDRSGNQVSTRDNVYSGNRQGVKPSVSNRETATNRATNTRQPSNNVYTDKSGNVYQQNNKGGWEQRQNNSWKSADKSGNSGRNNSNVSTRPSTNYNDLNRSSQNRSRGAMRTTNYNNYNRSYSSPSRSSGGGSRGGFSGGGGGRRR